MSNVFFSLKKAKKLLIFKYKINLLALLLFLISYYYYYLSLEKCLQGEDVCSQRWNWFLLKIEEEIKSLIIIIILIILIFEKVISKFHLFHFAFIFIYFYNYSHSIYLYDHGAFNLIAFFLILFIGLTAFFIIKIIFKIIKNKALFKAISILFLALFNQILLNSNNCNDWVYGLNNTYIDNDINKFGCQIKIPKYCTNKILGFTPDLSKIFGINCLDKNKKAKKNILKNSKSPYINKNTTRFGFPLTNIDKGKLDGRLNRILKKYSYKNILDMDKEIPSNFSTPEYIVDFSKDPFGNLTINLNYNETLSLERKNLEKNSVPYSDNVLIIYMDSVSRVNALRKLKKTLKFFEQFISYKGGYNHNFPNENFHSFQFFKYHTFQGLTFSNFIKLFYGNLANVSDFKRISKYYKENGYITSYAIDDCNKDNTRTGHNLTDEEMYDHQLLLCDPNKFSINNSIKRCLYGNLNAYYLCEYIEQFWRKYKNNRKYSLIVINDGHEGTLEVLKYTDDILYNFLNTLFNDNLLKDSTIFLLSDHGCAMPAVYYINEFFQIEKELPMLYMIINDIKYKNYNQQYFNIHENQQTFITAYDIYNTIANIIYGDNYIDIQNKTDDHDFPKSPKGISLFEKINQKERKPSLYPNMSLSVCI